MDLQKSCGKNIFHKMKIFCPKMVVVKKHGDYNLLRIVLFILC